MVVGPGDHPRSRGVYLKPTKGSDGRMGSSPLARGLLDAVGAWHSCFRIIPARAGFTCMSQPREVVGTDHPRSRGVYWSMLGASSACGGSSPLARGLLSASRGFLSCPRIIPARAGFTVAACRRTPTSQDHPRSRGVYCGQRFPQRRDWGSSPLARGLLCLQSGEGGCAGIIPARAGFTVAQPGNRGLLRDHPRSRGVYARVVIAPVAIDGSSPLARGLPNDGG